MSHATHVEIFPSSQNYHWTWKSTFYIAWALILVGAISAYLWPLTHTTVPWDSKNHFYPMYQFLGQSLKEGETPFWNPYHFGGHPAVADPQSLIFTPSLLSAAFFFPHISLTTFDILIFAHLIIGSLGVLALFRDKSWHPAGAFLAGCLFMIGSSASSRLQHTGIIISYAFIPLAFFFLKKTLDDRSFIKGTFFAIFAILMTLGRDQVAFLSCWVMMGFTLFEMMSSRQPFNFIRERLFLLIWVGFLVGLCLIIPSLLTLQFLSDSNRPGIAYGVAAAGSLSPTNFITALVPNIFGSLNRSYNYWGPGYETMTAPDWTDRCINYLFMGTFPAVLFLWEGFIKGCLFKKDCRFFLIIFLCAFIYALGHYTPFFSFIFSFIPGVQLYRRPADATFLLNFAASILIGFCLHIILMQATHKQAKLFFPERNHFFGWTISSTLNQRFKSLTQIGGPLLKEVLVIALVGQLILSAFSFSIEAGKTWESLKELLLSFSFTAISFCFLKYLKQSSASFVILFLCLGLTASELIWRNAANALNAEDVRLYPVYSGLSEAQTKGLAFLQQQIALDHDRGQHPRVEILGLEGGWQNASMVLGLENTLGYNPLRLVDYERLVGPGENAVDVNLRHFPLTFRGYHSLIASFLGLKYLILDRPLIRLPRHVPRPYALPLYTSESMYIYRLGQGFPRAYFATRLQFIESEENAQMQDILQFDRFNTALIERSIVPKLRYSYTEAMSESAVAQVKIIGYHNTEIILEIDTTTPGLAVLHDLYYPGWEAFVDGESRPILRANFLFRGVEIPAGHHRLVFTFRPFQISNLLEAFRQGFHQHELQE